MKRHYTTKQMGNACEMLVAAELTLAGIPAMKVPDNWPGYDVIAQPVGAAPQKISVKSRTFKTGGSTYVEYEDGDDFDWLAVVLLPGGGVTTRRLFVIPRAVADMSARRNSPKSKFPTSRYWRPDEVPQLFAAFENNFGLEQAGRT